MMNCICHPNYICCHLGMSKYWTVGMLEYMLAFCRNPCQRPFIILIISQFQQGSQALALRISPCEWLALHTTDLFSSQVGDQPSYPCVRDSPLSQQPMINVDFHPCKSNLQLIITLLEQHYNNLYYTRQLYPMLGQCP